jgi:glycosyltransferase involved in cell wall biosynthesis
MPSISVIVPAYNAEATLGACIESLRSQTLPAAEIIVVDDGSRDRTVEVARQRGATVIALERNGGPGVARNAGAAAATGEILAFTDSDCVPPPDWLERITAPLAAVGVVAATGGYAGPVRETFLTRLQDQVLHVRQRGLPAEIESTITSNFACKRSAFIAVGGFPLYARKREPAKPIWGNEDEELGFLLTRNGTRIRWVADAGVYHAYRGSLLGFLRQQKFYAERIVMSHFRFPEMAEARSNYSRSSGVIHLGATLALGVSPFLVAAAPYVHHCASWLSLPFFVVAAMAFLLLPVPLLIRLRRQGNGAAFLFKAFPVLLAVSVAWLGGAITGTLLTIGGFIHVTQQSRPTPAALVR